MGTLWQIEIEPEVRQWLELLTDRHYDEAERAVDMLAAQATTLGEPYSRHLGGKVRELRFTLDALSIHLDDESSAFIFTPHHDPQPLTTGQDTCSARCVETRTPGAGGGPREDGRR